MSDYKLVRLNKLVASAGICSRRDADKLIMNKKIMVNGNIVRDLWSRFPVTSKVQVVGNNDFSVDASERHVKVWLYNKPCGLVVSHRDENNRRTVFQEIGEYINERVVSVGRLDIQSQGLLVITNSGDLAHRAESSGYDRVYDVKVFGPMNEGFVMRKTALPILIDGITYKIKVLEIRQVSNKQSWIKCLLNEGKNREIRKIFSHFGLIVSKLIRIQYGPYKLDDLCGNKIKQVDNLF